MDFGKGDVSQWLIKEDFCTDRLEGEFLLRNVHKVFAISEDMGNVLQELLIRVSNIRKLFRIGAYLFKWNGVTKSKGQVKAANVLMMEVLDKSRGFG